jgi:DNA-binding NarL/FixJ family response regulator
MQATLEQVNRKRRWSNRPIGDRCDRNDGGPTPSAIDVPVPAGLRAARVDLAGDSYVVLTFPAPTWDLPDCLTPAEQEVARAILSGATNRQIAERRSISERTVAHQISSIFEKLAVSSRAELASRLAARRT